MKDTEFASKVLAIVERSLCVLGIQGSVFSRSRLLFPLEKFSFGCLGRHDGYPFTPYYRYELEGFLEDSLGLVHVFSTSSGSGSGNIFGTDFKLFQYLSSALS